MNMGSEARGKTVEATMFAGDESGPEPTRTPAAGADAAHWATDPDGWRVAIVWLNNASLTSLYGTYEDYVTASYVIHAQGRFGARAFRPRIVSVGGHPQRGLVGPVVTPDEAIDARGKWDAIIVPALMDDGSIGAPPAGESVYPEALKGWLRANYAEGAVVAGLCTGTFVLAESGLLDGCEATTHWLYERSLTERFDRVTLRPNRSMVRTGHNGRLITGGASAYVADVNLHVIARFAGPPLAREVARLFGKFWRDSPREERTRATDRPRHADSAIAVAQAWMRDHACKGATVAEAADHIHLNERTFARRFQRALGMSPADFLRSVRIERARELLERSRRTIDEISAKVGYSDAAAFRKGFKRQTGLSPSHYRKQFKLPAHPISPDRR